MLCVTISEIIQVSAALGIEINGVIKVNFDEIEEGIETALARNLKRRERINVQ